MVQSRKYVVTKSYQGRHPKVSDFKVVKETLPALKNGEILVKAEFVSVDPYLQFANATSTLPYDQTSFQVGVVQESKNPKFPVGARVVSHRGWVDYFIVNPEDPVPLHRDQIRKLPDLKGLSPSHGVGAIGMPGASAHIGLLDITQPKPGETVVVTGAAGAVGYLVGQIAKIKGCKVIGFAGSDDKIKWLEEEIGYDRVFNYKKVDITAALKEAAPNGVDIYFDNVGGEISSSIIRQMNPDGRVSVCGSISSYNDAVLPKVTILQPSILFNSLMIKGFIIWRFDYSRWVEAYEDLINWIKSGQIKVKEHVVEGFDKIPDAFIGMLTGENFGKAVVKV